MWLLIYLHAEAYDGVFGLSGSFDKGLESLRVAFCSSTVVADFLLLIGIAVIGLLSFYAFWSRASFPFPTQFVAL